MVCYVLLRESGIITGYNAYADYGSSTTPAESTRPGEMLICMEFLQSGKHLPVNWDIK